MKPTYENTTWERDVDDLQYLTEGTARQLYADGVRFICVLKFGEFFPLNKNGEFSISEAINWSPELEKLLEELWVEYNNRE